jgi:hypothetical protein
MNKKNQKIPFVIDSAGLILIGLFSLGYCLFSTAFAETRLNLPFLNFPIFVGEILFLLCLILLFIKWRISRQKLNIWHYLGFFYFAFVLLKASLGYFKWGPLALRHSALFYYPLFAIFGGNFYRRDFFDNKKVLFLILLLVVILKFTLFYHYFLLTCSILTFILIRAYPYKVLRNIFICALLIFIPYNLLFYSARTIFVGNLAVGIYMAASLPFILRIKVKKFQRIIIALFAITFILFGALRLADSNAVKSLVNLKPMLNLYNEFNKEMREKEKYFKMAEIKRGKLYNAQVGLAEKLQVQITEEAKMNMEEALDKLEEARVKIEIGGVTPKMEIEEARMNMEEAWDRMEEAQAKTRIGAVVPKAEIEQARNKIEKAQIKIKEAQAKVKTREAKIKMEEAWDKMEKARNGMKKAYDKIRIQEIQTRIEIEKAEAKMQLEKAKVKEKEARHRLKEALREAEKIHVEIETQEAFIRENQVQVEAKLEKFRDRLKEAQNKLEKARLKLKEAQDRIETEETQARIEMEQIQARMEERKTPAKQASSDRSLRTAYGNILFRIFIWQDMLSALGEKKPFLGFEFGRPFRSKRLEILNLAAGVWRNDGWVAAHNSYLEIIYRAGIVGISFIITIFVIFLKMIKNSIRQRSVTGTLLCAILVNWLVMANFAVILELPYSAIPFWSLFGMTFAHLSKLQNN